MRRILVLAVTIGLSTSALAMQVGSYVGLGAGVGKIKTPDQNAFNGAGTTASHSLGGFSGRAFAGFTVNSFFGVEAGITRYARSYYQGQQGGNTSTLSFYSHTYDVVGKLYLPLAHSGFNLYALGGAARVAMTEHYNNQGVPNSGVIVTPLNPTTHYYSTRPIYGAGVGFEFGSNISANVEYTQIRYNGTFSNNSSATPNMDMITANLAYHIC